MSDGRKETATTCTVPPEGWWCSREAGHDGPCAARPSAVATERIIEQAISEWATIAGGPHYDRGEHVTLARYIAAALGAENGN